MRHATPLALLAFLTAWPVAAQGTVPDPTDPARYFPLEVGNEWAWVVTVFDPDGGPVPDGLAALELVSDTTIEGVDYAVGVEREWVVSDAGDTTRTAVQRYLRFDAETATVRVLRAGEEHVWYGAECGLDVPFSADPDGSPLEPDVPCPTGGADGAWVTGGADESYVIGQTAYAGRVKRIAQYYTMQATFVADVGQVWRQLGDFGHVVHRLQYAKVGGVEYGEPTGLQTGAPVPLPRVTSIRWAYPNPFADAFTLSVDHPRSGPMVVEVFDVLGRRVYADRPQVPVGRTDLRVELPPGSPGVYTARVRSARDRWPARPVRLVRIR